MIAMLITLCRIVVSIVMMHFPVYSVPFFCCYVAAGITDILGRMIARKLGAANGYGARLDSTANLSFSPASFHKLFAAMIFPGRIWVWIGMIAIIEGSNLFSSFLMHKRSKFVNTFANIITGFILFLYPITESRVFVSKRITTAFFDLKLPNAR